MLSNELAANLSLNTGGAIQNHSICTKQFSSIQELSDAHIFPKALGYRQVTITCRGCNNDVGSKIESHEVEKARLEEFVTGNSGRSHRVLLTPECGSISDESHGRVTAEMTILDTDIRRELYFKVSSRGCDPKTEEAIAKSLRAGGGSNVQLQSRANIRKAKLTYLHSAFLFLFSQLGYRWALDPCTTAIREQIQNPDQDIINFSKITLAESDFINSLSTEQSISWYEIV